MTLEPLTVDGVEEIVFSVVDPASPAACLVMTQYFTELGQRFAGGFDADQALEDALETLRPPQGVFVLASSSDGPVACGAVRYLDAATAEIKRMWVSPQVRGMRIGKRLLAHLEGEVLRSGRSTATLDTNESLNEAIALYRACGYAPIDRYNDNPYAQLWFSKALTSR